MESVMPDDLPRAVWTMAQSGTIASVSATSTGQSEEPLKTDASWEPSQQPPGFTLRVKPDRRRAQLSIPGGVDRRRPRA